MKLLQHLTLIGTLLLISCSNNKNGELSTIEIDGKQVPILKFNEIHDTISLNLTEIFKDVTYIKLETRNDNKLVRGKWSIGDKYIIGYIRGSGFFQFESNGKYIRKLANYGKGPFEVSFPYWTISKDESHIYIYDSLKPKNLLCIDLKSGSFQQNIPIALEGMLRNIELLNDSVLICAPIIGTGNPAGSNYLFWQTLSGKLLKTIPARIISSKVIVPSENLLYKVGDKLHYRPIYCDTVFLVKDFAIEPYLILDANKSKNIPDYEVGSKMTNIFLEGTDFIILQIYEVTEKKMIGENTTGFESIKKHFFVDKTSNKAYIIYHFNNDLFGFEEDPISFADQSSSRNYIYLETISLLKRIERLKSDPQIKVIDRKRILDLEVGVTESDNPILITGTTNIFK
jgi:hypothetical protein